MTLSTVSLTKTTTSPPSLWGDANQLVVVVAPCTYKQEDYLLAYGIDPTLSGLNARLFERMLPLDALGDFISVLIKGGPDEGLSDEVDKDQNLSAFVKPGGPPVIANSVDVTNSDPQPPGPKLTVVIALAKSITTDESLAEVCAYAA
jgi:hypothetical protein